MIVRRNSEFRRQKKWKRLSKEKLWSGGNPKYNLTFPKQIQEAIT